MNTIKQIKNLKNKTVLLRGDLDVPLENGKVADDFRLKRLLSSIEYLVNKGAKVIIIGHLGRPGGKVVELLSVKPVAEELRKLLDVKKEEIKKLRNKEIKNCLLAQSGAKSAKNSDIVLFNHGILPLPGAQGQDDVIGFPITENIFLLENLRFYEGEEKNDLKFAKALSELGNIYVNDAFANSHRKHASIVGITKYLPSYAGLNLEQEVKILKKVMENPKRPAVAIMGGAKIETKLPLIERLAEKFDYVLVGGRLGMEIEKSQKLKACPEFAERVKSQKLWKNIILPLDYIGSGKYDIGERTIKLFSDILTNAKTVIWNGPLGKYEDKRYMKGTKEVAAAIINSDAYSVAGGGDIISALDKLNMTDEFDFISTGGGAMLEFLEKGSLLGLEILG
ncbi:MAG: phosphoglycerate kinase [bacterium]